MVARSTPPLRDISTDQGSGGQDLDPDSAGTPYEPVRPAEAPRQQALALVPSPWTLGMIGGGIASAFLGGAMIYLLLSGRLTLAQVAIAAWGVYQFGQRLEGIALGAGSLYESALFIEDFSSFAAMKPEVVATRPVGAAPSR